MQAALGLLLSRAGTYAGLGTNHDGDRFRGVLLLEPVADGRGVRIRFTATGLDGTEFHAEDSLIAADDTGHLVLATVSSNLPGLTLHAFAGIEPSPRAIVFRHGDLDDEAVFREEIRIHLGEGDELGYAFAWGLPGGPFAPRSAVTMRRIG